MPGPVDMTGVAPAVVFETRIWEVTVADWDTRPCVSLFYVNDTGSIGSRGRTVGIPYIYPSP